MWPLSETNGAAMCTLMAMPRPMPVSVRVLDEAPRGRAGQPMIGRLHCEIQQTNTEYIRTRDALFLCRVYLGLYRFAFSRHSDQAHPLALLVRRGQSKSPPTEAALHLLGNPGSIVALAFEHVECPSCRRVQHTADKSWLLAAF